MNIEKHAQWLKERDEAVLTLDIKKFRAFIKKWTAEGVYNTKVPDNDMILEIAMRQMLVGLADAPESKVIEAQLWLIDHGCDPHPWRR